MCFARGTFGAGGKPRVSKPAQRSFNHILFFRYVIVNRSPEKNKMQVKKEQYRAAQQVKLRAEIKALNPFAMTRSASTRNKSGQHAPIDRDLLRHSSYEPLERAPKTFVQPDVKAYIKPGAAVEAAGKKDKKNRKAPNAEQIEEGVDESEDDSDDDDSSVDDNMTLWYHGQ